MASLRRIVAGFAFPLIATSLAALPITISTATAAMVYVLAVTASATLGGIWAGLVASFLAFLGLNFFFTPPFHTFAVNKGEDLIALVVFLLVSATVGTLISTALTQRARAQTREHEAQEAREDAEINRSRAALFSSVTHDLRTPLASITASVTGLLSKDVDFSDSDRRELLGTIRHEADRLNRVVGNLLDLSRMRAGALVPAVTDASMEEVVAAVVGRLEPQLDGRSLLVDVPDELPDVRMDVVQMDQVLTNLIENASRYSPVDGRVHVVVEGRADAIRVRVEDEGPGVADPDRERVFEPFVRGPESAGTGLGLAISKAIVEAHGGRIWIEDREPMGTTVAFELPMVT